MIRAYIGLGSNIECQYHFKQASQALACLGEVRFSTCFEAEPVGFSGGTFYNAVAELNTSLSLSQLQGALRQIEWDNGRPITAQKNQDRTLDLDLLLYGNCVLEGKPQLPRDDIFKFAFVLKPLVELCPQLVVPNDGRTVSEIWQDSQFDHEITPVEGDVF